MRKNLLLVSLLALCFMGMTYTGEEDIKQGLDEISIETNLQVPIVDSGILSDEEDCFSAAAEGDLSEKGKGKKERLIPSLSKMDEQGYKFFITALRNVSDSADLMVHRSRSKKAEVKHQAMQAVLRGETYHIATRVPRTSQNHLIVFDNNNSPEPLWKIYQSAYREHENDFREKTGLFIKKRGEREECILLGTATPQIVALMVRKSKIEVELPGRVEGVEQSGGVLSQLSASLPSLPSFPSFTMPSLFSDEGSSSSSCSSGPSQIGE